MLNAQQKREVLVAATLYEARHCYKDLLEEVNYTAFLEFVGDVGLSTDFSRAEVHKLMDSYERSISMKAQNIIDDLYAYKF